MREIKFRGINSNGEWVVGYLFMTRFTNVKETGFSPVIQVINDTDDGYNGFIVKLDTIGQYTNLKDKNGKEIYEGDICSCNNENYLVSLKEIGGAYKLTNVKKPSDEHFLLNENNIVEVIGNIHEHSYLLNEK